MADAAHHQNDDEPALPILLPAAPAIPEAKVKPRTRDAKATTNMARVASPPPPTTAQPTTALATLASVFDVQPADQPGVWLVDPRAITVDAMNARFGVTFVVEQRTDLIHSMAALGNTVPIKLRRMPEGPGFRCFSGAQRLGAALVIQQEQPAFRLRAIIHDHLIDDEAFRQGEADNAGRTDIGAMQQARHWGSKLDSVYAGDRKALMDAIGKSASVVSRTLALLALPPYVLGCCADPETLTPYFAEQLVPKLGDPGEEPAIRRRAEALARAGKKLTGPKLVRALLNDASVPAAARTVWLSSDSRHSVSVRPSVTGGRFDIVLARPLRAADKRALMTAIANALDALGGNPN